MKTFLFIIGFALSLYALFSILPLILNKATLSDYGQGYIMGKAILGLLGLVFIFLARRKNRKEL